MQKTLPIIYPEDQAACPIEWLNRNRDALTNNLLEDGAVLLRGFNIHSLSEFNRFSNAYTESLLSYENRSTPRTRLGGKIYTSTEYPKDKCILQHNENSYTNSWPNVLLFFSVIAAETGGETPLADSRNILKNIDQELVKKFDEKRVLYVRNYHPGVDLSWQEVFQTEDKQEVEQFCKNNDICCEWFNNNDILRTKQICQATTTHPTTKEKVWFNQAHLFNVAANEIKDEQLLMQQFGLEGLPRNTYFGDGETITRDILQHIDDAIQKEKFSFPWEVSDILFVDNLLMTHGRNAFTGERKVAVAMA
ncbi:MAG: TauD/TfdA family dioxygenase [Gammaproteobacteria bacterium]|nr:TauD/TfdA family dioxygenase [Gammaproteobacteria bacterium]